MKNAHDITSGWPSRQPREVSAGPAGLQVDEVFFGLIEAVVDADRELAKAAAKRAVLVDQTRQWVEATAHTSLLGIGNHPPAERASLVRQVLTEEIGTALRIPAATAESLVETSKALTHTLTGTMDALTTGAISYRHAETIVDEAWSLPASAAADEKGADENGTGENGTGENGTPDEAATVQAFEEAVLPFAEKLTVAKFRVKARKLRERTHPETVEARRVRAAADRAITFTPARDGMAWLSLYLEAPKALAIHNWVTETAISLQGPEEDRTLTQLRADVAADFLLETGHTAPTAGTRAAGGIRPTVMVTVPVLTLLGLDEEPACLDGYGPIDAATARELAGRAPSFTRLLTHPETGAVLSVGKKQYTVPKDMRTWLRVRDGTCRFPGCNRNAKYADVDHTTAWEHDGETRTDNLAHLCPKHHKMKHETGWNLSQGDDGALVWVSPSGHRYTTEPDTRIRGTTNDIPLSQETDDPWADPADAA